MIARTEATGHGALLPEVLRFTSSLQADLGLLEEDLLGSLAHATMLGRQGILGRDAAQTLRGGLLTLWREARAGTLVLADEEDVHMAVEAELTRRLGAVVGRLHTGRSRNDQVALDLRLHVREQLRLVLGSLGTLLSDLAARAEQERTALLPAYTHRQRAQAVSFAYFLCSYGAMFLRDIGAFEFALKQVDVLPLGVGAIAGTGLAIDRELSRALLGFSSVSLNGMDTVGDRDFALDFCFAAARCHTHCSRIAADVIDLASTEFGFLKLDDAIACGSSLMPQKKNPDLFELVRGKASGAIGRITQLFVLLRGLPVGYQRDLQEDRGPLLEAGPAVVAVLEALRLGLSRVALDRARALAAVEGDYLQAVDLAEALVRTGLPFREAYQAVGRLVASCKAVGLPLGDATPDLARAAHPALGGAVLEALAPAAAVARKESAGGTGPAAVASQIAALRAGAAAAAKLADQIPSLAQLAARLEAEA